MDTYIGTILLWPISWAPDNWLFCQGQELAVSEYQALFSLIGYAYGGDGKTTFALPDLRGRVPVGVGQNQDSGTFYTLAQQDGNEYETTSLTEDQLPPHDHGLSGSAQINVSGNVQLKCQSGSGDQSSPTNNFPAASAEDPTTRAPVDTPYGQSPDTTMAPMPVNVSGSANLYGFTQQTGGGAPLQVPIMQPFLGLNYIICVSGIYPPRP